MQLRFFTIPVLECAQPTEELNAFLRDYPKAIVEQQLILDGQQSMWAVCCKIPNASGNNSKTLTTKPGAESSRKRIDYRDILEPEHFARYAVLRELRNQLASEQNIPAYSIFSNAQLAEMAQIDQLDRKAMEAIEGIGEKRVARYADQFIKALEQL